MEAAGCPAASAMSRRRGRQRERQCLAVPAGPQRVVRRDRLPQRDRHGVVADGAGIAPQHDRVAADRSAVRVQRLRSENEPLTSLPVPAGSCTLSIASPAVEITFAPTSSRSLARHARGEGSEARGPARPSATAWPAPSPPTSPGCVTASRSEDLDLLDPDAEAGRRRHQDAPAPRLTAGKSTRL